MDNNLHQEKLIAAHRRYLQVLDLQIAKQGGSTTARTSLVAQAAELRAAIERLKAQLRAQGRAVADDPIDTPPLEVLVPAPAPAAPIINITIGDNNHFENSSITVSDIANTRKESE